MNRAGVAALLALAAVLLAPTAPAEPAAAPLDVHELVRRAEDATRGKTAQMKLRMKITTPRFQRELVIRSFDDRIGDRSFTRVLEPPKDKGTGFLRVEDAFWTWLPRVERAMRIPPSMMLQPWMGSDFTNDDLARESSLEKDYEPSLLPEKTIDGVPVYGVALLPKPEAPVVWARLELWLEQERLAPMRFIYFEEREPGQFTPLRELWFSDVRMVQGRPMPHRWRMRPLDKDGHETEITLEEVLLDAPLADDIFTQKNLRQSEAVR